MTASLFTFENLYRAWLDCRRNKRRSRSAMEFEADAERHLIGLSRELRERVWHPSPSVCFVARNDKYREVFAAAFRDRVVHHFLVPRLERIWEPVFIHDSYACRKGRGTHGALRRLRSFIRKVTANCTTRAHYLQLDIRSFFPSVDKRLLLELLLARLDDPELRWLVRTIVLHDPTEDPVVKGSPREWRRIPGEKSLFGKDDCRGLPIGNLTSQFFANVYLNGLDQFVKHGLRCWYYLRYVDDFVLLHQSRAVLLRWQGRIDEDLRETLRLRLHPHRRRVRAVSSGIDFLGYVTRASHVLVRRRTVDRFRRRIADFGERMFRETGNGIRLRITVQDYQRLHAVLASYLGIFSHADAHRLVERIFSSNPLLEILFDREGFRVRRRLYAGKTARSLWQQYDLFRRIFHGCVVGFQVGSYLEFYDADALEIAHYNSWELISPRRGFRHRCGTHMSNLQKTLGILSQRNAVMVMQTGLMAGSIMDRQPQYVFLQGRDSIRGLLGRAVV